MRSKEFITESAKLWGAKVRINQANYVGYVDAQVWAPNAQIARTMLKQQYQIQDHHVGSIKEIKMKAKEFVLENLKEANYNDPDFNPRVEMARIVNLKLELADANPNRREEIAREIKQIEAQLRLYAATQPEKPAPVKDKRSDDGTPYTIYYDGQVSGRMLDTDLQGAKNAGKHTVMRQLAHTFAIVTDNAGNIVFVWYPGGHERPYEVGDKYNAPGAPDPYKDRPRYPPGHPHAGAPMPPNVPITTDWSKLPDGGLEAWMQGGQEPEASATTQRPEVYMGQAQRVDQPGGLPRPRKRR